MKKEKKNNKKKGFTLIELLVAVLIIGVLAAIALPSYMRSVERSRATGPMTNLGSIAKAQNRQRLATMHYTDNVGNLDISLKDETNGEDATGNTFESEFFTYRVYGDDKAVAVATRKDVPADKQYELSVNYATGQIYCRPIENKTCIDLGLEEGIDYASSEAIWENCLYARVSYHLPYADQLSSCYRRENNGKIETMKCDSVIHKCALFVEDDYNARSIVSECAESNTTDGFCNSYDSIYEGDDMFGRRDCTSISGLECEEFSSWSVCENALSCEITDNNGVKALSACYEKDGCGIKRYDNGYYSEAFCDVENVSNGACSSYDMMYEESPSGWRECISISGQECVEWTEWTSWENY